MSRLYLYLAISYQTNVTFQVHEHLTLCCQHNLQSIKEKVKASHYQFHILVLIMQPSYLVYEL